MPLASAPRLWLDGADRLHHRIGADEISNDLAGWIADDLVALGLIPPGGFERTFVDVVLSVDADQDAAWTAFYRNTLDALARGGDPGGTNAGMAPVYARAVELAAGPDVVELGCCFGFLALQLVAAGRRVTAIDLLPSAARLLASMVARLRPTRSGHPPLVAIAGDAAAAPLATASADTVFAVHLLEHLPPAAGDTVLAEMLRIARQRVVVAVPFEDEPNPTWGHVRTFNQRTLDALGAATGRPYTVDEHHGGWLIVDL